MTKTGPKAAKMIGKKTNGWEEVQIRALARKKSEVTKKRKRLYLY